MTVTGKYVSTATCGICKAGPLTFDGDEGPQPFYWWLQSWLAMFPPFSEVADLLCCDECNRAMAKALESRWRP